MKTLERQFFRYCIRRIDYSKISYLDNLRRVPLIDPMMHIASEFSEKKNCSFKQLEYYMLKWKRLGLYYGFDLTVGLDYFNLNIILIQTIERNENGDISLYFGLNTHYYQYSSILPLRVKRKINTRIMYPFQMENQTKISPTEFEVFDNNIDFENCKTLSDLKVDIKT